MKLSLFVIASAAALLSACAGNQTCNLEDADYRKAAAIPPIQPAEGLNLPQSASALKVPPLTAAAQAAAQQPYPKKGKGTACLDYPPEIVVPEPATPAAKS